MDIQLPDSMVAEFLPANEFLPVKMYGTSQPDLRSHIAISDIFLTKAIIKACQDLREGSMISLIDGMGVNFIRRTCGIELNSGHIYKIASATVRHGS